MKILLVQDYLRSGGTERQTLLLARGFAGAGHEVTLLTFRPGGKLAEPEAQGGPAGPAAPPYFHRSLQTADLHLDWFAPGLGRTAAAAAPDIVLCMGRMANCYGGRLQARLPRAAVVATLRTGKSLPWLFRRSLARVRHIVANSGAARDRVAARLGLPAAKISVIRNALFFPPQRPRGPQGVLRDWHGAAPATVVLLCVAMFRPEKRQRELVEILAGLPAGLDWQLWLAGDGPARPACAGLVRALGLEQRVKFLGYQPDASSLYEAGDIAVHASATESLSNFIIEAQAHGLPAVACEAQGIRECLVPDRTGWVVPDGDRGAFRAAVIRLIEEGPEARARRGAEARAFASAAFDPATQVEAYLRLFAKLIH